MAFSDEFDTSLEDDGSTVGMTYADLDNAAPGTNLGFEGLELDPSATDNLNLDPETWGGGKTISDPSISDQMALSGVTDPPPSEEGSTTPESGSGTAAPAMGAGKPVAPASGFLTAFSKFGSGLGALFTKSGAATTARIQAPTSKPKPSNGVALALVAILVVLVITILFGSKEG